MYDLCMSMPLVAITKHSIKDTSTPSYYVPLFLACQSLLSLMQFSTVL